MMSMDVVRRRKPFAPTFEKSDLSIFQLDTINGCEQEDVFEASETNSATAVSAIWTTEEMAMLAQQFIDRTELLIDETPPPPWEDEDDLFHGERFSEEEANCQVSRRMLSLTKKAQILRALFHLHIEPNADDAEVILLHHGWAMFFRKRLLDPFVSLSDKREILKRIYTTEPPEWMDDEVILAKLVLLNECKLLARSSANMDRRQEIKDWIFTPPKLENQPFSFKHCVMACGEPGPGLGQLHERLREQISELLPQWTQEAITKKEAVIKRRVERTGQQDLFLS